MLAGDSGDRDVARDVVIADTYNINCSDVATGAANRCGQLTKCSSSARQLNAQGQTVAGAGRVLHLAKLIPSRSKSLRLAVCSNYSNGSQSPASAWAIRWSFTVIDTQARSIPQQTSYAGTHIQLVNPANSTFERRAAGYRISGYRQTGFPPSTCITLGPPAPRPQQVYLF